MKVIALTLLMSLAPLSIPRTAAAAEDLVRLTARSYVSENKTRSHCASLAELKTLPVWTAEGVLPLPPEKAVQIARSAVLAAYPDVQGLGLKSLKLERVPLRADQAKSLDHWFYDVDFYHQVDGKISYDLPLYAIVLLNGKVVPPTDECAQLKPWAFYH